MSEENSSKSSKWTDQQIIYLDWLASPKSLREPKTQTDLADKLGVHRTTLTNWRDLEGFKDERLRRIFSYFTPDTPDIVVALRDKSLMGDTKAIEIWLERVEQIAKQMDIVLRPEERIKELMERVSEKDKPPQSS